MLCVILPTWMRHQFFFDLPGNRTINLTGEKTVFVRTIGNEKNHFTVVLCCTADGTKLKPMIIFKRKTLPKVMFPSGVVIHVNEKGWMDTEAMMVWLQKVWAHRPGASSQSRSLLVWDSFRGHLVDRVKERTQNGYNTDIAVIPGGLTSVLQPLDVSINRSFKSHGPVDHVDVKWAGRDYKVWELQKTRPPDCSLMDQNSLGKD